MSSSTYEISIRQLQIQKQRNFLNKNSNILVINDIQSDDKAVELISSPWFKDDFIALYTLWCIKLKISGDIDENFDIKFRKNVKLDRNLSILIIFESSTGNFNSRYYWKICEEKNIYMLNNVYDADGHTMQFCMEFLIEELKQGKTGILRNYKCNRVFKIQDLGNEGGSNLLLIAVQDCNLEIVKKLTDCGFHVEYEDYEGRTAIDHAWILFMDGNHRDCAKKIIYHLLRTNSRFPSAKVGFKPTALSKDVKALLNAAENLHILVSEEKYEQLLVKLNEEPGLCHFYNRNNQSLLGYALSKGKFEINNYIHKGICIGYHEEFLQKSGHILQLKAKCQVNCSSKEAPKYWLYIEEAFKLIDSDSSCSKILSVASMWKKLKIYFDIKHDVDHYLTPSAGKFSQETAYSSGVIYIGAKNLTDDMKNIEVHAALMHELCLLVVLLTYSNDSNPFSCGNSNSKASFKDYVVAECDNNKSAEIIINKVFDHPQEYQCAELITSVVVMKMFYSRNEAIYAKITNSFPKLFEYFRQNFEVKLNEATSALKLLQMDSEDIKYQDLTKSMKVKLNFSTLTFQGVETSFYEIFGADNDILSMLSSNDIRDCLLKGRKIIISKAPVSTKSSIIRRKFVDAKLNFSDEPIEESKNIKNYMQIKNSKAFLLADACSKSRTSTFEDLAVRLKESYKTRWILYAKVINSVPILEKFLNKKDVRNCWYGILSEVQGVSTDIEKRIIEKLMKRGLATIILDGIDDADPKVFEFLLKVLRIANKKFNNHIFISFNPQHIPKLEEIFSVTAYKPVVTIYRKELRKCIEMVLRDMNFTNAAERFKKAQEILNEIDKIEKELKHLCNIDNESMIQVITELYIDLKEPQTLGNVYETFDKIVKKQQKNVEKAGKNLGGAVLKFHQAYALKLVLGDKFEEQLGFKVESLAISRSIEKEKHKAEFEKFLRYGFMIACSEDNSIMEFVHNTYAEFFIAQFILTSIFDLDNCASDNDAEKIFKILLISRDHLQICRIFLLDFMKHNSENVKLNPKMKTMARNEACSLAMDDYETLTFEGIKFWSYFFYKKEKILRILWQVGTNLDALTKFMTTALIENFDQFKDLIELIEFCFGCDWHNVFNKTQQPLVYRAKVQDKVGENFQKLLSYTDCNLTVDYKKLFYKRVSHLKILKFVDLKILNKMLDRVCAIYKDSKANLMQNVIEFVEFYFGRSSNEESMVIFGEKFEDILGHEEESIREVLFYPYRSEIHPLIHAIKSENIQTFRTYKDLYVKYKNSYEDIQDIFIQYHVIFKDISFINDQNYPEFEAFFKEVLDFDKNRIKDYVERFFKLRTRILVRKGAYGNMMEIMNLIYEDFEIKAKEIPKKFITYTDFLLKLS